MNPKYFNILAIAAVTSLMIASIVHSAYDTWTPEKVEGDKFFPNFDKYADEIAQVVLQKGETTLTFNQNKDGNWHLAEHGAYPVMPQKIREMLGRLAMLELVETKTRDPKRYNLLELDDPAQKNSKAKLITLSNASGTVKRQIVIGKQRYSAFGNGKSGSYVRRPEDVQTWLANIVIQLPLDVPDWVDPVFFKLPLDKFHSVELTSSDEKPVLLVLEEQKATAEDKDDGDEKIIEQKIEPKFKFSAIPQDKKLKDGIDATKMIEALQTLELTDVRKAGSVKAAKDAKTVKVLIRTKDDMKLAMTVLQNSEDNHWVSVKVNADGKDAEAAKKLKANLEGWEFKISDWRSRQIFKTRAEMFDDRQEKKKTDKAVQPSLPMPMVPPNVTNEKLQP